MNVTVDRESMLSLLCDFLEKSDLTATLSALEAEADVKSSSPGSAAVRNLALGGKWRELEKALLLRHEEDGQEHELFKRAQFSLAKQQYLETVAALDAVSAHRDASGEELEEVVRCLGRLERLAPSREEFATLRALSDSPTDFFDGWNLQKARKETCGDLLDWCREDCYRGKGEEKGEKKPTEGEIHRLTLLLAKGKIYEQCERIFTQRCMDRGPVSGETSAVLDMGSWLKGQPDSVFQEAPRLIRLVETTSHHPASTPTQNVTKRETEAGEGETGNEFTIPPTKSNSTADPEPKLPPSSSSPQPHTPSPLPCPFPEALQTPTPSQNPSSLSPPPTRASTHREKVEAATEKLRHSLREETRGKEEDGAEKPQQVGSSPILPPPPDQLSDGVTFNNDFCQLPSPSWALQTTPLHQLQQRRDRDSSTPKLSTQHSITSPPTSPVPHLPSSQATPSGWSHSGKPHERKQIDFRSREVTNSYRTEEEEQLLTISWPTAKLIGKVTDSQAVRSVGFSESGQLVAVGANSKSLRILSTAPLLDSSSGEELTAVQELPRYHRGSIYCLAWSGDGLLASGSNDKAIKLLACRSNSGTFLSDPRGRMSFHQGTVRELVFLTDTLLASGGSGAPPLLLTSDCETMKMISSLSGHEKPVLALACGGQRSTLFSGGEDGVVRVWDWASGRCVHTLTLSEAVTSLSALHHTLAAATVDGSCAVYDVRNWSQVTSYQPHSDECRSLRHSPCGKWLLTGSYDGSVCLGEAEGTEWVEVAHHEDKVVQARWHPNGEIFASTSSDKTAAFWTLKC